MFLRHLGDYTPTKDETSSTSPARGRGGPDPRYRTHWIREDNLGPDRRTRLQPGDVVIRISDDDTRWTRRPSSTPAHTASPTVG
ncbi:hypothetical protein NJ76_15620, partial [Rhodococcus sp. IITR03]